MEIAPGVRLYSHPDAFDTLAGRWRHWSAPRRDPYLDPLWYKIWWQSFGHNAQLMLLEMTEPVSAIVPLMLRDGVVSFLGNVYSHRQGMICPGSTTRVWEILLPWLESLRDWSIVNLRQLPVYRPEVASFLELVGPSGTWVELQDEVEQWAIPVDTWPEHWKQQGRNSRKKRQRVQQNIHADPRMRIVSYHSPQEAVEFARVYFQVMVRSWKPPEMSRDFFRRLCRRFAELGWFSSFALFCGDDPIAFQFGFLIDGVYYCYKTAYDDRYSSYSPGIVIVDHAIQTHVQQGVGTVDLLTGNDIYKRIWCNRIFDQVGFFYPTSLRYLVAGHERRTEEKV